MKAYLTIVTLAVVLAATGPVMASDERTGARSPLENQCAAEALWPQTASHSWADAAAHRRAQIHSSYNPDISQARRLCAQWSSASPSAIAELKRQSDNFLAAQLAKYGQAADAHVSRMSHIFAAFADAQDLQS